MYHLAVHVGPFGDEDGVALCADKPFPRLLVAKYLGAILRSEGLLIGEAGSDGPLTDCLIVCSVRDRARALTAIKSVLSDCCLLPATEIAWWEGAECVWRYLYPVDATQPFERWFHQRSEERLAISNSFFKSRAELLKRHSPPEAQP